MNQLFDIPYDPTNAGDGARTLDLFLPEEGNGAAIFFIHGGGWAGGGKAAWHEVLAHFCNLGYACASTEYHLAPTWRYPVQVEDVRMAMAFFRGHAAEYGFAPDRIAVWGSSSGGHLAAMLATISAEDDLGAGPGMLRDTRPNAAVCLCSVLAMRYPGCEGLMPAVEKFLGVTEVENSALYREASPLHRITGAEPPFLLVIGDQDTTTPLVLHEQMRDALAAHGVPVEHHVLPGVSHGYGYGVKSEAQQQTLKLAERFLEKVLLQKTPV